MSKKDKAEQQKADEESTKVEVTVENGEASGDAEVTAEQPVDEREALEAKLAETEDRLLRAMADFENYKKRTARQYEHWMASANDGLLGEMLEIIDNFERALAHASGENNGKGFEQGIQMIYNQMSGLLGRYGVTPIESVGKPFDANLHDAMIQMPSDEYDEGVVVQEISKGYKIGDRVLRHSRVAVSKGPESKENDGNADDA